MGATATGTFHLASGDRFAPASNEFIQLIVTMAQLIEALRSTSAKWRAGNQEHRDSVVLVWDGDLRNTFVAHNDENAFETVTIREVDGAEELALHLQYAISFPFDRLYELRKLIRLVELHIVERQKVGLAAIKREVSKLYESSKRTQALHTDA